MPLTPDAIFTVNGMVTLPPPGMVKVLQVGTASPTAGLVVEGRVAPPVKVTVPVEA